MAETIQIADVILTDDPSGRLRLELDTWESYTFLTAAGVELMRDAFTAWLEQHPTD
jgi:hypothetical protein